MKTLFAIAAALLLSNTAYAAELVQKNSPHSVQFTMDKLRLP